jgi:hypothetical protein
MAEQYEFMMLLLGIVTLLLVIAQRKHLLRLPHWYLLLLAYGLILAGWVFTILEHVRYEATLNLLEHAAYTAGALVLAYWCWLLPDLRRVRRS